MNTLLAEGSELLYREAMLLDERRWDEWISLFTTNCEYWVPAWKSEDEPTSDPKRELSLVYYANRSGLEDRVWRVKSGRAVSAMVLPRTQHVITNIRVDESEGPHQMVVASNWTVHQFLPKDKTVEVFFGRYRHLLVREGDAWRIARKKVVLLNDYLPAKVDYYSL